MRFYEKIAETDQPIPRWNFSMKKIAPSRLLSQLIRRQQCTKLIAAAGAVCSTPACDHQSEVAIAGLVCRGATGGARGRGRTPRRRAAKKNTVAPHCRRRSFRNLPSRIRNRRHGLVLFGPYAKTLTDST